MCGRFSLSLNASDIKKLFDIDICDAAVQSYIKTWNIAPSMSTPALLSETNSAISMKMMKWGRVRSLKNSLAQEALVINTRSENFLEKAYYSNLLETRCAIPATGYFEWMRQGKNSIPFYIKPSASNILFFAAVYDEARAYSILTTEASEQLKHIHRRMPFILDKDSAGAWIREKNIKASDMSGMLLAKSIKLEYYSVSAFVNSVMNNSEKCIERVLYNEQPDLF